MAVALTLGMLAVMFAVVVARAVGEHDNPAGDATATTATPAPTTAPAITVPPAAAPPETASPDTAPQTQPAPPPPAPGSQSIDELIAVLSSNPDAFGEKGKNLLKELIDLAQNGNWGGRSAKLAEEINKWVAQGKLDATIGSDAMRHLGAIPAERERGRNRD
jgi:hypothetical protein